MDVRILDKNDIDAAAAMYVRRMADSPYIKNAYRLRRGADRPELEAALAASRGAVLSGAIGCGTSFGAWDAGRLAGIYICFWYKAVRQYDGRLFGAAFRDRTGKLPYEQDLHGRVMSLGGAVLYGMALCTEQGACDGRAGVRLVDAAVNRLRPDWLAGDAVLPEALSAHERPGCAKHVLDDGRTLCIVKTS